MVVSYFASSLSRASSFLNRLSAIFVDKIGSSVVYPCSLCSSALVLTMAPFVPGMARGLIPFVVNLWRLYSSLLVIWLSVISCPRSTEILFWSKGSVVPWLSARYLSVMIIAGIWNFSARLKASMVLQKHSSRFPGAITALGNSPWLAWIANLRSPWAVYVGSPVLGPGLWTRRMTGLVSVMPVIPSPSVMRQNPPPEVAVMVRTPAYDAPAVMLIAAISLSVWITIMCVLGLGVLGSGVGWWLGSWGMLRRVCSLLLWLLVLRLRFR